MLEYQVGGSLAVNNPTYIERKADSELFHALLKGELCYILTSRQMGKSSLRLRTRHRIESTEQGYCASIDMTRIGSENITPDQWYQGIAFDLLKSLKLYERVDLSAWWIAKGNLSSVQKLGLFLEQVVLEEIPKGKIFIFIDEIDSVQSLNFPVDDFFAVIRCCYNQRAENPNYNRIVLALFGVASPSELISDVKRTPFNVGKAIALPGFTLTEAMPLLGGLKSVVKHPQQILKQILEWTDGQPFLTQKLCAIVQEAGKEKSEIFADDEEAWVEGIVRSRIIENWQMQDEPEHLRTIQNYILYDPIDTGRLLGLYQQILLSDPGISLGKTYASREFAPLILSGLVTYKEGVLRTYNQIYREIFNLTWVEYHLANLRPYATNLDAWVQSDCQDEAQLLKHEDLRTAEEWSRDKNLSDLDYRFLAASQKSDRHYRERRIVEILAVLHYRNGNLKSYLQEIAIAVSELLNVDWSVVTLCDGDEEHILASSFDIGEAANQTYSLHITLSGHVLRTCRPLIVENTEEEDCQNYGVPPEGYRSYLGVPLRISTGELVGTICSFHSTPRKFSKEEIRLVSIFAERAASAIENYQLYQKLQEMNEKLEEANAALSQELSAISKT